MSYFYVDGAYEARGPIGAYCIVSVLGEKPPTWEITRLEPQEASQVEFIGLQAAIKLASSNLPAKVFSDSVWAIKRLSDYAKRLDVELKHVPGHLTTRNDIDMTDDVKKHHWAHVQAYHFVQNIARDLNDSHNKIKGIENLLDKKINKSVQSKSKTTKEGELKMSSKRVKTTKIEKQYTDKKTGEKKTITIDYAKVIDRVNEFRGDNPRGTIKTEMKVVDDLATFSAYVKKDNADEFSAVATGHAVAKVDFGEKQFEKLETVAVGRALAMLGYASSGEIASFEEMEEFTAYRDQKIEEIIENINGCHNIPALRTYFMGLEGYMAESRVVAAKDKRKAELMETAKTPPATPPQTTKSGAVKPAPHQVSKPTQPKKVASQ